MKIEEINALLEDIDLNGQPPSEEPARQYYYLKKCRRYVEAEKEPGQEANGLCHYLWLPDECRDSEKLSGILEQAGYVLTDSEEADFDIYNTCTVRDNADQRVYGRLGHLNSLKEKSPYEGSSLRLHDAGAGNH